MKTNACERRRRKWIIWHDSCKLYETWSFLCYTVDGRITYAYSTQLFENDPRTRRSSAQCCEAPAKQPEPGHLRAPSAQTDKVRGITREFYRKKFFRESASESRTHEHLVLRAPLSTNRKELFASAEGASEKNLDVFHLNADKKACKLLF